MGKNIIPHERKEKKRKEKKEGKKRKKERKERRKERGQKSERKISFGSLRKQESPRAVRKKSKGTSREIPPLIRKYKSCRRHVPLVVV